MRNLRAALFLLAAPGLVAQGIEVDGDCLLRAPAGARRPGPVLVLFDPGCDAAGALNRAAPAADASGITLVVSRTFRDYLDDAAYAKLLADLKALLSRRFPASPLWAGGFSGGGRIAVGWAQQEPGFLRGVVCFGAFYDRGGLPPPGTQVFLACGSGDPLRAEMAQARGALQQQGYAVAWESFLGGHQWPPPQILSDALRFVQVRSLNLARPAAPAR